MAKLSQRLMRRYKMTIQTFRNDCAFSYKLACLRMLDDLSGRTGFIHFSNCMHCRKEKWILTYLYNDIELVIKKYQKCDQVGIKETNVPIWVCWWTGLENAPFLVRQCIKSIQKHSGKHPVCLITKENYKKYIEVPDFIYRKMQDGKIGLAHFADYLRVSLIAQYGGIWLDATIFCAEMIPEEYFDEPFFTCKSPYRESRYLSHFEWATFCLGGWKGNVWYLFMQEAFEEYWRKEDSAIDYLFFDSLIFLAREHIPAIKKMMEQLPNNTPHRDDLQAAMNAALPEKDFCNVIQKDTPIYKLSWREEYKLENSGNKTVYYHLLKN